MFEEYGFKLYFNQYTYKRSFRSQAGFTDEFIGEAQATLDDPDYEFRYITKKEYSKGHEYFHKVYNKAWAGHSGVKPMSLDQAKAIFKQLKPIADVRLIWFAFYKEEPVAFFISIPELNQIYKRLNGQWNLFSKLKFLLFLKMGVMKKGLGIFGVMPEHQRKRELNAH